MITPSVNSLYAKRCSALSARVRGSWPRVGERNSPNAKNNSSRCSAQTTCRLKRVGLSPLPVLAVRPSTELDVRTLLLWLMHPQWIFQVQLAYHNSSGCRCSRVMLGVSVASAMLHVHTKCSDTVCAPIRVQEVCGSVYPYLRSLGHTPPPSVTVTSLSLLLLLFPLFHARLRAVLCRSTLRAE